MTFLFKSKEDNNAESLKLMLVDRDEKIQSLNAQIRTLTEKVNTFEDADRQRSGIYDIN